MGSAGHCLSCVKWLDLNCYLCPPAGDGVTLCVGVHYEASSPRRISLRFQEAGFSDVHITPLTEALIAPAILPRGWLQQQVLLAIKEVSLFVCCIQVMLPYSTPPLLARVTSAAALLIVLSLLLPALSTAF